MMEEKLKSIRYKKRTDIPQRGDYCAVCGYGFANIGNSDDRLCKKHNIYVGAYDGCDYFENYLTGKFCNNCRFMGNNRCAWDGEQVNPFDKGCNKFEE